MLTMCLLCFEKNRLNKSQDILTTSFTTPQTIYRYFLFLGWKLKIVSFKKD